jgi:hypothetical protein
MNDVLNPVVAIKIRDRLIEVKEMPWKDYLRAVKDMTGTLMKLIGPGGNTLALTKENVIEALTAQEELLTWVLQKCTGEEQTFISSLSAREILPLIQAAVDLNLSQEVVGAGKKLAGQMGQVFGLKKQSPGPLTTSSAPATPLATSKP